VGEIKETIVYQGGNITYSILSKEFMLGELDLAFFLFVLLFYIIACIF